MEGGGCGSGPTTTKRRRNSGCGARVTTLAAARRPPASSQASNPTRTHVCTLARSHTPGVRACVRTHGRAPPALRLRVRAVATAASDGPARRRVSQSAGGGGRLRCCGSKVRACARAVPPGARYRAGRPGVAHVACGPVRRDESPRRLSHCTPYAPLLPGCLPAADAGAVQNRCALSIRAIFSARAR